MAVSLWRCTPDDRAALQRHGIVYRTDRKRRFKVDGLPNIYQTTFDTTDDGRRHGRPCFSMVAHIDVGLNGHQDMVVARNLRVRRQGISAGHSPCRGIAAATLRHAFAHGGVIGR